MKKNTEYERIGLESKNQASIEPSTIETIDLAIYEWLDKQMNIHTHSNRGWKKTPVIWVNGERAHQIKFDRTLRDVNGNFILPVITLQRETIVKSLTKKGTFYANVPPDDFRGGTVTVTKLISQEKSGNYAKNNNNKKFVQYNVKEKNNKKIYEVTKIPLPVYVDVKYTITVSTEYQQQMNEIIQPFMTYSSGINYFKISKEQHIYEAFFDKDSTFKNDGNVTKLENENRLFKTEFSVNVLGYLLGGGANNDRPKVTTTETIVEVKFPREREWFGEKEDVEPLPVIPPVVEEYLLLEDGQVLLAENGEPLLFE
jgi:hypothetical protein